MDTIQALPLGDILPTLAPFSHQTSAGKVLQNAEFSRVFREASERSPSAEALPEESLVSVVTALTASADILPPGGKVQPLLGRGIAAQSFTSRAENTPQAFAPAISVAAKDLLAPITIDPDIRQLSLLPTKSPLVNSTSMPVTSAQPPAATANLLTAEGLAPSPIDLVNKAPVSEVVETELLNMPTFRAESLRTDVLRSDARRVRADVTSITSDTSLPTLNSVLPTLPPASAAVTTPAPPLNVVMQPGAPLLDSLGEKIVWLTRQDNQQATLQLRPAELGAVEIRVSITHATSTQIEIHAQQADTGDLIESMLPKLQQALEQQGLKLDDVRLSQQSLFSDTRSSQQQPNARDQSQHTPVADRQAESGDENDADVRVSRPHIDSAIDTYA